MTILWLRKPADLSSVADTPVPLSVELITLPGKDSKKSAVTPPPAPPQPKQKPQPKQESEPKPSPKPAPKNTPVKEKLPDVGEIEQLIKSRSVKQVAQSVQYQPDRQSAHAVSSAIVMPPPGHAMAKDNFPVSDIHNPSPEYPEMAVFLGYQGDAIIRIKVSAQGLSEGVEILRSSGHKILDESAVKALRHWRFTPSKHGNTPMSDSVIITVSYVLYHKDN
jgi:protein TonB